MWILQARRVKEQPLTSKVSISQGLNCIIAKIIMMMMMLMMTKMAMMIPKFCLWFKKIKIVIVFWNNLNFAATTVTSSTKLIPVVLL